MSARIFVDTNVLVYAYDRSEPEKQHLAFTLLDRFAKFFVSVTRKLATPLSAGDAYQRVSNYLQSWTVLDMTGMVVLEAIRGVRDHQLSFWDAQIWAVAKLNRAPVVFSEDFSDGQVIEGVRFVNPFVRDFQVEAWA
jgi:predicted nucleic acid-binding protein